jgi:acyl-CoA hydrolase
MAIHIEVMADRDGEAEEFKVTEGIFVFVALDKNGQPRPVDAE